MTNLSVQLARGDATELADAERLLRRGLQTLTLTINPHPNQLSNHPTFFAQYRYKKAGLDRMLPHNPGDDDIDDGGGGVEPVIADGEM